LLEVVDQVQAMRHKIDENASHVVPLRVYDIGHTPRLKESALREDQEAQHLLALLHGHTESDEEY